MIKTQDLRKVFKTYIKQPGLKGSLLSFVKRETRLRPAVDGFDLEIGKSEFVGLLGPNGAGKTTLMKMLTGIIVPTSGEIHVLGHEPFQREREFRKRIALVMGQKSQLWWDIPAMDSFLLLQRYYEIPEADFRRRLDDLTERLGVGHVMHVHVRKLSLGERMKMELMSCLLHRPDVIFLDEPTIGLDLVAQKAIREFLAAYQKDNGITVVLTSHYMADVEALCERIVLILDGKKRFDGPIRTFENILGKEKFVSFRFASPVPAADAGDRFAALFPEWNEDRTEVDLRIAEPDLRRIAMDILDRFPVVDFHTDKMPVERVMKTLLDRPELIGSGEP